MTRIIKGPSETELDGFPDEVKDELLGHSLLYINQRSNLSIFRAELLKSDKGFRDFVGNLNFNNVIEAYYAYRVFIRPPTEYSSEDEFWDQIEILDYKYQSNIHIVKGNQLENISVPSDHDEEYIILPKNVRFEDVKSFLMKNLSEGSSPATAFLSYSLEELIGFAKIRKLVEVDDMTLYSALKQVCVGPLSIESEKMNSNYKNHRKHKRFEYVINSNT